MIIGTRDFGEVEIDEQDIVTFCQPIFGFEEYSTYVFLYEQGGGNFVWLQSLEERELCFVLVSPAVVTNKYEPSIPKQVKDLLGAGDYLYWLVAVILEDFKGSTVNMKGPIVVNPKEKRAAQVLLEEDLPIRQLLVPNKGDGK